MTSRRDFIKTFGIMVGASTASTLLSGNKLAMAMAFHEGTAGKLKLFNSEQKAVLFNLCDAILPKTDTPSATELNCHQFIEHQLLHCYPQSQQEDCIKVIDTIFTAAQQHFNTHFDALPQSKQQALLRLIEQQDGQFSPQDKERFIFLKSLLVFGYFTTEVGATKVLAYQAVPGGFKGSIPYTENSKAWGSLGFY